MMRTRLLGLLSLGALATAACSGDEPVDDCEGGTIYAEPGCAGDEDDGLATIEVGCFEACSGEFDACADGGTCTEALTNPCICEEGEDCCGACGAATWLCL